MSNVGGFVCESVKVVNDDENQGVDRTSVQIISARTKAGSLQSLEILFILFAFVHKDTRLWM